MRQDDRAFSGALERGNEVQEKRVIAILLRRDAIFKAAVDVVGRFQSVGPGFGRERGIGDGKIEGFQPIAVCFEERGGERIPAFQFCRGVIVQDHVHLRESPGRVVHLLSVDTDAVRCFIGGF